MNFFRVIYCFSCILITLAPGNSNAQPGQPSAKSFNQNWKFYLGEATGAETETFNDAAWRSLQLPHDWSIELPFDSTSPTGTGGGALRGGLAGTGKHLLFLLLQKAKIFLLILMACTATVKSSSMAIHWAFAPMDLFLSGIT